MSVDVHLREVLLKAGTFAGASGWVVVVCPDRGEHIRAFDQRGASLFPMGSCFVGRTAILPTGGRVSVVSAGDAPFIPPGTPFDVLFFGWEDDLSSDVRHMRLWRDRAVRVLS